LVLKLADQAGEIASGPQDLLALSAKYAQRPAAEETINDPTVRKHYWRYRCHVDLETVLEDKAFIATLQRLLLGV
jgi:4-alpha-glucanotransferase